MEFLQEWFNNPGPAFVLVVFLIGAGWLAAQLGTFAGWFFWGIKGSRPWGRKSMKATMWKSEWELERSSKELELWQLKLDVQKDRALLLDTRAELAAQMLELVKENVIRERERLESDEIEPELV